MIIIETYDGIDLPVPKETWERYGSMEAAVQFWNDIARQHGYSATYRIEQEWVHQPTIPFTEYTE